MYSTAPFAHLESNEANIALAAEDEETADEVSSDEVAIIFGFLPHDDIMRARQVCTTWRDAAKMTVPSSEFVVGSERSYNAMRVMTAALPSLQQIALYALKPHNKYSDGEDPDERRARDTAHVPSHDINIISNFSKLRSLDMFLAPLNGRYPALFNFPLLEKLSIAECSNLRFDLDMLQGLPSLKEFDLDCDNNPYFTGNLRSLRVLKDTLEKVVMVGCFKIRGSFMDLADFPRLEELCLRGTEVTGHIRDIGESDFPALEESLALPDTVHGGEWYKFQHISEVPSFMYTIHVLLQRAPSLFSDYGVSRAFYWRLSKDSPDVYDFDDTCGCPFPPFDLQIIRASSRLGWSWCAYGNNRGRGYRYSWRERYESETFLCEINWLDAEPNRESSDYETYFEELQCIQRSFNTDFYRGYYEPPNEEEYRRLCEELLP